MQITAAGQSSAVPGNEEFKSFPTASSESLFQPAPNAIYNLLQPSIVRSRPGRHTSVPISNPYVAPTARDIPPVTLTPTRHVGSATLQSYIKQTGAIHDELRRFRDGREGLHEKHIHGRTISQEDIEEVIALDGYLPPHHNGAPQAIAPKRLTHRRRDSTHRGNHEPPLLTTIPSAYFEEGFDLRNPRIFNVVSERSDIIHPKAVGNDRISTLEPRKALATNAILQEKLSWYIDIAELHLVDSISMASTAFLSALDSLNGLHMEAAELNQNIQSLRKDLASLDGSLVVGGLKILQKQRIRHNLRHLQDAMQQLKQISDRYTFATILVGEGKLEEALAEIDEIELLTAGERANITVGRATPHLRLCDMRGLTCLRNLSNDIAGLRSEIGIAFENQIRSLLISDLQRHAQSTLTKEVFLRWDAASLRVKGGSAGEPLTFPAYSRQNDELRAPLCTVISGLHRSRHLPKAIQAYRDVILQEVRDLVRKPLPSSTDDADTVLSTSTRGRRIHLTAQEKSSILARNIRSLDENDADNLLSAIFIGITETLRRVTTQSNILLDVSSTIGAPGLQNEMHSLLDIASLLSQAVEVSHEKIIKILRVRAEQTMRLSLDSFLRYFTLHILFINECEAISGHAGTALKTVVYSHVRDYITKHANTEAEILTRSMSCDVWQDEDFTPEDSEVLSRIITGSSPNTLLQTIMLNPWTISLGQESLWTKNNQADQISDTKGKIRAAVIDEKTFIVPKSAITCLHGISHFLRLMSGIPFMAPEITSSLLSYLQMFDSRCRQLVLGAGAILSVGLERITHTNLIAALQAIIFVADMNPYIKGFAQRHKPLARLDTDSFGEFDKVQHDLHEHQEGICDKLVDVLLLRVSVHSRAACDVNWNLEKPSEVRQYMVGLVRDIGKIHKALSTRQPSWAVTRVMDPVLRFCGDEFQKVFRNADLPTEAARNCMLADVDHLTKEFSHVEGFSDQGARLRVIITNKEIVGGPSDAGPAC